MAQPTEDEILAALAHYRACILQRNHDVFQRFVQKAETEEPPEPRSASRIAEARQRYIYTRLNVSRPSNLDPSTRIDVPADVLTKWDALARAFALDGVYVGTNPERREQDRAAYKSGIEAGLRRIGAEIGFPADFDVVMNQVDSLEGQGWPQYRSEGQQVRFWDGLGESEDEVADRVYGPDDGLAEKADLDDGDGWEVVAGWECGCGPETSCFIVYCQNGEIGKAWAWRYVFEMGQYGTEIFDNVAEMLRWYETLYMPPLDHRLDVFIGKVFR